MVFTPNDLPPLARSTLDRAAHRRNDKAWLAEAVKRAQVLVVDLARGGRTLVREAGSAPRQPTQAGARVELVFVDARSAPPAGPGEPHFLGVDSDGTPYFAVAAALPDLPGTRPVHLRDVGGLLSDRDAGIFTTAVALCHWHARSGYSPASGQPTATADGGWARVDPAGGQHWPRTDPAVIVLVHDGVPGPDGRCLLGHNSAWTGFLGRSPGAGPPPPAQPAPPAEHAPSVRRFSCLAGFVEAGESAEAAVLREVAEEVGIKVNGLTYVASQAWPFPCSLMLGFFAYADPEQPVRTDQDEIDEARWFTRREISAVIAGEPVSASDGAKVGLPMPASIAYHLINRWLHQPT